MHPRSTRGTATLPAPPPPFPAIGRSAVMAATDDRRPVLCVGLLCLDIVNICDHYPEEDGDMRAKDQQWRAGGNAANSSVVLSLLGRQTEFLGTLGHGVETDFAVSQLERHRVAHSHCVVHDDCTLPTSCVVLSSATASRTIVHFRKLPELSVDDFSNIDISQYSWIHFEGRCPETYCKMIERVVSYRTGCGGEGRRCPGVSVELEKRREDSAQLASLADVVFFSKEYAQYRGYGTMEEAVNGFRSLTRPDAVVVCAWGERGAAATNSTGETCTAPASPPSQVRDTLGAGDTFNAGFIHKFSSGHSTQDSLIFACQLAGAKCGMSGFDNLATFQSN